MNEPPRDDARLSADALRMRESIERRLFAPAPRVVVRPGRRRWRLDGYVQRGSGRVAIALVLALVLGVVIGLALR
jgi:hypothetical protein